MKTFSKLILIGIFLVAGCSDSYKPDTFMSLNVEGEKYEIKHMTFDIIKLGKENKVYISLGQSVEKINIIKAIPGGGLYFDMILNDKDELLHEVIDFNVQKEKKLRADAEFTLTEDLSLSPDYLVEPHSSTTINITGIHGEYIEGEFEGHDWILISIAQDLNRKINVTGKFRAKLRE